MAIAKQTKQFQIKQLLLHIAGNVADGKYGKGDDIDGELLHDDLEGLVEDDIPEVTGYGK